MEHNNNNERKMKEEPATNWDFCCITAISIWDNVLPVDLTAFTTWDNVPRVTQA
jgi:hypothetical protein